MWFGIQSLKHNPNGRFVVVCGDGEYIIYTALAWRNRSFGSALEFAWSTDGEYAVRESTSKIKIFNKTFQVGSHAWNLLFSSSSLGLPHDLCLESWLCIWVSENGRVLIYCPCRWPEPTNFLGMCILFTVCLLCRKGKAFDQIFLLTVFMVELCLLFAPVNLSVSTTG